MRNKKSQVFITGTVLIIIFGLVAAFISIHYLYSEKSTDESLGTYEAAMIDAMLDGEKSSMFTEQAAKLAANDALKNFAYNGGIDIYADSGEDISGAKCGRYIYNLWDSETRNCYPDFKSSFSNYMASSLKEHLSSGNDVNFNKNILMDYSYKSYTDHTKIIALAADNYDYYLFKNQKYKTDQTLNTYLTEANSYAGSFIWPLDSGTYRVSSCFGFRNTDTGTSYHGGIDIPTDGSVPVYAAAAGTVSKIIFPDWGRVEISHGSGIRTEYLHLDTIDPAIKEGNPVTQHQKIGTTGKRYGSNPDYFSYYHLHFAVIDDNVPLTLAYKGAPAVVDGNWGKYVNPVCYLSKDYLLANHITMNFNMNSLSCSITCDYNGNNCYSYPGITDQAYKFCDLYTSAQTTKPACQTTDNSNWKITNMRITGGNGNAFSADQVMKITISVSNDEAACASVFAKPVFTSPTPNTILTPEHIKSSQSVDVLKSTASAPYVDIKEITCYFTTDFAKAVSERQKGNCYLGVPTNSNSVLYKIDASAIDVKGRIVDGDNSLSQTITVTEPRSGTVGSGDTTTLSASQPVSLSSADQKKFDITKNRLMIGKLPDGTSYLEYAQFFAQQEGVPKEILLGVITQESAGVASAVSSIGAVGLTGITKPTFDDASTQKFFKDKCTWDQLKTDVGCQIRSGVAILNAKYFAYGNRQMPYNCPKGCSGSTSCFNKVYTGWDAALRGYNGYGCNDDNAYVDNIMKWAGAWGYSGYADYAGVSKDLIDKGVIGQYKMRPSFTTTLDFDSKLFDNLVKYMKITSDSCKISTGSREDCVNNNIKKFNTEISSQYKSKGINVELTRDCESSDTEKKIDNFIQSAEECKASAYYDCQCPVNNSGTDLYVEVNSNQDYSSFTYTEKNKDPLVIYSTAKFYNDANTLISKTSFNLNDIKLYKEKDGFKFKNLPSKQCIPVKNRFKMCLKTNFTTYSDINGKIAKNDVILRYAITIRDNLPPDIVKGLNVMNKNHTVNSLIVTWDKNAETDIAGYLLYLGNTITDFNSNTTALKNKIPYRTFNILNSPAAKYSDISYDKSPTCLLNNDAGVYYCTFMYDAITSVADGSLPTKILLEENKLYFLESKNKYLYVINGTDPYNQVDSTKNKFIAVTAFDLDNNEINNTGTGKKISTANNNLKTIKPNNLLEPGLATNIIAKMSAPPIRQLTLSFDPVKIFLDKSSMQTTALTYNLYVMSSACNDNVLTEHLLGMAPINTYTTSSNNILNTIAFQPGNYCLIVTTKKDGLEYSSGLSKNVVIS